MFILVHRQKMGYDDEGHTTNIFVSLSKRDLEDRIEIIKKERDIAQRLVKELTDAINNSNKTSAVMLSPNTNFDQDVERIRKLENDLDRTYPFWRLCPGDEGESFEIEGIGII